MQRCDVARTPSTIFFPSSQTAAVHCCSCLLSLQAPLPQNTTMSDTEMQNTFHVCNPTLNAAPHHQRGVSWGQTEVFGTSVNSNQANVPSPPVPNHPGGTNEETTTPSNNNSYHVTHDDAQSQSSDITTDTMLKLDPLRRPHSASLDISVDDVRRQVPREHEADTRLLQNIERQATENTEQGPEAILAAVPNEALPRVARDPSTASASVGTPRSTRSVATPLQHRRKMTLDQELFGLTAAIDALQEEQDSNYHDAILLPKIWDATTEQQSSGDALQNNATLLYRRMLHDDKGHANNKASRHLMTVDDAASSLSSTHGGGGVSGPDNHKPDSYNSKKNDDDPALSAIAENDVELGNGSDSSPAQQSQNKPKNVTRKPPKIFKEFQAFWAPQRQSFLYVMRVVILYLFIPLLGMAALLFYALDNPPTGRNVENSDQASASWWLLFVLRQSLTGLLAKFLEWVLIDFLSIRSSFSIQVLGPWFTLFIMQSRGWPFLLFLWALLDFALLAGSHPFFSHWLHGQDAIAMFTDANPAGNVVSSDWNHRVLAICVSLGIVVSVKRFWLGLHLGRQTYGE